MGYLKLLVGAGVLAAACVCANAQAAYTQDQETPAAVYDVSTDYGWTMSSRDSSGYYTFGSPLRMKARISFTDLGNDRVQMELHFYEVSYTDDTHSWTIEDFSDLEKISAQFREHCSKGANLEHFTELAAFEEEALGYMMALSHGATYTIDLSEDAAATYSSLSSHLLAAAQTARHGPGPEASYGPRVRASVIWHSSHRRRLGMIWTQQLRHLAMFALRPACMRIAPGDTSLRPHQTSTRRRSTGSTAGARTRTPAFSLSGLYRWLPNKKLFVRLKEARPDGKGNYVVSGLGSNPQVTGAWFVRTNRTCHELDGDLRKTPSGRVKYRRMVVESRLGWVDAFAFLPNGKGLRGTIKVSAKTVLEATLLNAEELAKADRAAKAAKLEERIAAVTEMKDYARASGMCRTYLRIYPNVPRSENVRQRLAELGAARAERAPKRIESWTKMANLAVRNGRPDMARRYLSRIISEYPETAGAAEAEDRLSALPGISTAS